MPFFHTGGINALSIPILMAGGTVVVGRTFDEEEALRATDKYKATISLFVPTMYQRIIETDYFKQSDFPSMNVFLSGGAPCPPKIYRAFQEKGLAFKEGYGFDGSRAEQLFHPPGGGGEKNRLRRQKHVVQRSESRARRRFTLWCERSRRTLFKRETFIFALLEQEKETKEAFCGEWFKTGDLAKYDEDGDYYIVGRKKDMIITGGENVYPQEVENCLLGNGRINEAAVIGVPDEKWGEKVVAFITLEDDVPFDEDTLKRYCRKYLGDYKVPKQFFVIDSLPKTDVGKIDKNSLLERFLKGVVQKGFLCYPKKIKIFAEILFRCKSVIEK